MNPITPREHAAAERPGQSADQRIIGMTSDGRTGASIEEVLRRRIEEIAQAIREKNVDRLLTFYSPDVTVFDIPAPLEVSGKSAYRANLARWFDSFKGPLRFELHNLRIAPGDGAAFCHYLGLVTGARAADHRMGYWVRGTTCFERRDGEWLVTHEHISMPRS